MDITVRHLLDANKLTTFFKIDSQIAAVLIAAGLACQYVAPAPPPEVKTWSVGHPPNGDARTWLIVWSSNDGSRMYFAGAPSDYLKAAPQYCGSTCPLDVVELYQRVKDAPVPFVGLTDRQRNEAAVQQAREKNARQY